jgi:hypothetical protein
MYRTMGDDFIQGKGAEFIQNLKKRSENDLPFVNFDFYANA